MTYEGENLDGWLRHTSWAWICGLFAASLVWALLLPSLIYNEDYDPTDMVCGSSTDELPKPWCKSDPFDVWWQDVLHVTDGAKAVALISHILNFGVAPLFTGAMICRVCGPGINAVSQVKL